MSDTPTPKKRRPEPMLVIAVTDDHAYVAFIGRNGDKARAVRDGLRERHKGRGIRFHLAPSSMPRWNALEAQLLAGVDDAAVDDTPAQHRSVAA